MSVGATFRHSYRFWLGETGAALTVQKELMRHASIQTTMNIYGKAMTNTNRQAHRKVVEMVLKSNKTEEAAGQMKPVYYWERTGVGVTSGIRATH